VNYRFRHVLLSISLLFVGFAVSAGDAVDTRVTFTLADDNVMKGPEETSTGSPSIPNFEPNNANRLFFDDYERRDTGFENLTHLVLYAHQPGFFDGLDTEAALVLRAQMLDASGVMLKDDGSYIKLTQEQQNGQFLITAFPVSANRFKLGYSYDISWGGSRIFRNTKMVPGVRLEWKRPGFYSFLGTKTGRAQMDKSDGTKELDTVWGVLAGAGLDIADEFRMEANGGYFYRGTIDKQELKVSDGDRIRVAPWLGYGTSVQLSYHVGMPIGTPIDFRLYKNDPLKRQTFFRPEVYGEDTAFALQSEVSILGQTLQDPESPSSTTVQPAIASDISAKLKTGRFRYHGLMVFRDLAFILYNVPSSPSFVNFPDGVATQPELFLSLGLDYAFEESHFTPGFILGVQRPAHMTSAAQAGNNPPDELGQQTFVYRSDTEVDILDAGDKVALVYAAKGTMRWDLSEIVSVLGELQLSYDQNRRTFAQDEGGIPVRLPQDPFIVGFNMLMQARF